MRRHVDLDQWRLGAMNKDPDRRGRYDAVMGGDGLFQVEPAQ
jgi:hypothetical protein